MLRAKDIALPKFDLVVSAAELGRIQGDAGGVYFLYREDGALMYIGKSVSLRNRVSQHVRGSGDSTRFSRHIDTIKLIYTDSGFEQELFETVAINKLRPRFNRSKVYTDNVPTRAYDFDYSPPGEDTQYGREDTVKEVAAIVRGKAEVTFATAYKELAKKGIQAPNFTSQTFKEEAYKYGIGVEHNLLYVAFGQITAS
jgi:hypothetical protein